MTPEYLLTLGWVNLVISDMWGVLTLWGMIDVELSGGELSRIRLVKGENLGGRLLR